MKSSGSLSKPSEIRGVAVLGAVVVVDVVAVVVVVVVVVVVGNLYIFF